MLIDLIKHENELKRKYLNFTTDIRQPKFTHLDPQGVLLDRSI